jgi:hypothetical protein
MEKIEIYLNNDLIQHLKSFAESKNQSLNQSIEEILASFQGLSVRCPDTILQKLYGIVSVEDSQVKQFWNGRKFCDDPRQLKVYLQLPQKAVKKAIIASPLYARWNNLSSLLELMGYPYGFEKWETKSLEKLWLDSNLNRNC